MRTPRPVVGLLSVALAACTPQPTSVPASSTAPAEPSQRAAIVGDAPAVAIGAVDGHGYLLPAAGIVAAGESHVWVVGFGAEQGDEEVVRLASADGGTTWEVANRRVGRSIGLAFDPPGVIPGSVLAPQEDGGEWTMYFAATREGGEGGGIWRATAPGPDGPWTADADPVLAPADVPTEAGGDPVQVDYPAVVRTDDGFRMLFGWSPTRATTLVRAASSDDGVTWTVDEATAIDVGTCGGFDERSVVMPRIAPDGEGGWLAVYGGFSADVDASMAIGLARSTDGVAWSCAAPGPILEVAGLPGSELLHSYALLAIEGAAPRLLVESLRGEASELWLVELTPSDTMVP